MCSHSNVTFYEQFDCFHYSDFSLLKSKLESQRWNVEHTKAVSTKLIGQPWNWDGGFNKTCGNYLKASEIFS